MTVQNRPVVATFDCQECGELATVHQYAKGAKLKAGLLYVRCGCGCDQRTGDAVQARIRAVMLPRAGFEHLKQQQRATKQETEKKPAPAATQEADDEFTPEPTPAANDPKSKLVDALKRAYS